MPLEPDWDAYRLDGIDAEKLAAVCAKFELNKLAKELPGADIRRETLDGTTGKDKKGGASEGAEKFSMTIIGESMGM